jgi:hypothetical protein
VADDTAAWIALIGPEAAEGRLRATYARIVRCSR